MRLTMLLTICAALLALPASTALAKAPPKGKYECTISGIGFGTVVIKKKGKYKHGYDPPYKPGKFKNPKGKKINFKTGPMKGIKGQWHRTNDGGVELELRNPEDGFEDIYCLKRGRS